MRMLPVVKSFFDKDQISYLIFYVTGRCNFSCNFCFYRPHIKERDITQELTLEEIGKISGKLGTIIQLSLTGGEPFLRDDLEALTEVFIKNNRVPYITIPTNASLTKRIVVYLNTILSKFPRNYFRIVFSIDDIKEQHDTVRSAVGSYEKILESYAAISPLRNRYLNLVLDANICYTARTEDSILNTLKTLSRDFSYDNLSITYLRGRVSDAKLMPTSFEKYAAANDFLEKLQRRREKRPLYFLWRGVRDLSREYLVETVYHNRFLSPCTAGRKLMVINERGEVFPCEILGKSFGNLKDYDYNIRKITLTEKYRTIMRQIKDSRCRCSFECALAANVLWGKNAYLKLFLAALKNLGKNRING